MQNASLVNISQIASKVTRTLWRTLIAEDKEKTVS